MSTEAKVRDDFLTVTQVCERLQLSRPMVDGMIKRGELPHRRFGRNVRIPAEALEHMVRDIIGKDESKPDAQE